jgi:hypothetical protein
MAQLILGVAGAAVGSLFGGVGAQVGWALGSALGAGLGPAQKQQGPRVSDLKVTGTEYGQPIPYIQGHPSIAGQIWWSSDRREIATTTSQGGKGGPTVETTTYTYEVDMLIGLTDNVIAGVTRIWSNGKLVWSRLSELTYQGPSGPTTLVALATTIVASQTTDLWRRMTVYTGAPTQLPDPTYEAAVGTANAPAYRGRGSVFIEGLQLGSAGQIPNLTFEVATSLGSDTGVVDTIGVMGTDYRKWGPITVDDLGITAHSRIWTTPYTGVGVSAYRLNHSGELDTLGSYLIATTGNAVVSFPISTDVPCLVSFNSFTPVTTTPVFYDVYQGTGASNQFGYPEIDSFCMSFRAGVIHAASQGGGVKKVYRFDAGSTGPTATSAALAQNVISLVSDGLSVYALSINGDAIYKLDASTLALQSTITPPVAGTAGTRIVLRNESDQIFFGSTTSLWRLDAGGWTLLDSALGACAITTQTGTVQTRYAMRDQLLYCFDTISGNVRVAAPATPLANETLQNVVSRLCIRAGLSASQFDVTALAAITKPVRALAVSQVSNTRVVLEMLMSAYFFEAVLSDKVYFRPRGSAAAVTIPYADLGASNDPAGAAEPFALHPSNELEIPAQIALTYINVDHDYQTDTQVSDRLISSAMTTATVQMALGFNPAEAKGIANAMLMDQIASWLTTKLALLQRYSAFEPTDVVTATAADGTTLRLRLVKKNDAGSVIEFDAVLDDATVLTNTGVTNLSFVPSIVVAQPPGSMFQLLDIAILRDADNDPGFYVAVKGTGSPYPGAAVLESRDAVEYVEVATVTESAVIGSATTVLGDWSGGNVFDETNSVTVDVGLGTLASVSRDSVLDAGANACILGSEILQFRDAALVSAGVYTLSGFLRGRRGTESLMTGHAAGDRFVLLQSRGLRRIEKQTLDIGATKFYKAVTLGRRLSSNAEQSLTLQSVGLKPFAPVDLRATARDPTTGDITLTWSRRTRLSKNFSNGSVPLGEATESYDVVIYSSNTFVTVKRTVTVTSPTLTYTSAQQVADFGSNQSTIYVRVFQNSATVGRGYFAQGSL